MFPPVAFRVFAPLSFPMKLKPCFITAGLLVAVAAHGQTNSAQGQPVQLPRPLTLDAAISCAVQSNPGLQRTREQIKEREGVLVEAKSARLPSVNSSASYRRTDEGRLESPFYNDNNWTVDVTVRQVLYAGGGVQSKIRSQREQLEAAKLMFTAALNDTVLLVRQQFYAVLLDRELIGVQEEALRVLETELVNARYRREAGSGSDFDLLRAEVSLANARPALIRARNAYRVAQDRLRASLGSACDVTGQVTDLDVQGSLEVPHRAIPLADVITAARAQRPELLQQERLIKVAEQGVSSARSGYLPTVSAVAGYEVTKPSLITTTKDRLDGWTAGVQASWNIFEGRATASRVMQARSRVSQANHTATERSLAVDVEVRQAHSALSEADELLVSSGKVVAQARESLRLARARFEAGTATQLDVLQAQSALTEARSNLAQSQHAYAVALAAIQRAMGSS